MTTTTPCFASDPQGQPHDRCVMITPGHTTHTSLSGAIWWEDPSGRTIRHANRLRHTASTVVDGFAR